MATMTSDGKQFVFCVFGSDGCECENLEAIFDTEEAAEKYVSDLRAGSMWKSRIPWYGHEYADDCRFYGRADLLSVECVELGKKRKVLATDSQGDTL